MYSINELSYNVLYYIFVNVMDVQSINYRPTDVRGLHEFFVIGLKILSVNVRPCDVRESM